MYKKIAFKNFALVFSALMFLLIAMTSLSVHAVTYTAYDATKRGYIELTAKSAQGYSETYVMVKNKFSGSIEIDFSSTIFIPATQAQRIGLAYEFTTGSYQLNLPAGFSAWLLFSSRCLDANRSAPSTGEIYPNYSIIPSSLQPIIDALRANASQSEIWRLTDHSELTDAWKSIDPRNEPESTGLDLNGAMSWQSKGSKVTIRVGQVENNRETRSGKLRLRLWALPTPYYGHSQRGYILASKEFNKLRSHFLYKNLRFSTSFKRPTPGVYYTVLFLEERVGKKWVVMDYINFDGGTDFE
jgi:hypothetical protein